MLSCWDISSIRYKSQTSCAYQSVSCLTYPRCPLVLLNNSYWKQMPTTVAAILEPLLAHRAEHLKALSAPLITLYKLAGVHVGEVEVTVARVVWSTTWVVVLCTRVLSFWNWRYYKGTVDFYPRFGDFTAWKHIEPDWIWCYVTLAWVLHISTGY